MLILLTQCNIMPAYKDKLVLDISDDDTMKDYLATKDVGGECSFTMYVSLDEKTEDQAVFSVNDVEINSDYEEEEEGEAMSPETPEGEAPPVMLIGISKNKGGGGY